MGFDNRSSSNGELEEEEGEEEKGNDHNICVSDSFVVDVERFSHVIHKKNNSTITLQRNVSRKGCNQSNGHTLPEIRNGAKMGSGAPEEPVTATPTSPILRHPVTATPTSPILRHHQIVVKNAMLTTPSSENKQYGPRHSSSTWSIDPRRILIFFATLSSLGTILLIYFTLSIGKLNDDNNDLN